MNHTVSIRYKIDERTDVILRRRLDGFLQRGGEKTLKDSVFESRFEAEHLPDGSWFYSLKDRKPAWIPNREEPKIEGRRNIPSDPELLEHARRTSSGGGFAPSEFEERTEDLNRFAIHANEGNPKQVITAMDAFFTFAMGNPIELEITEVDLGGQRAFGLSRKEVYAKIYSRDKGGACKISSWFIFSEEGIYAEFNRGQYVLFSRYDNIKSWRKESWRAFKSMERCANALAKAAGGRAIFDLRLPNGFELVRLRDYLEEDIQKKSRYTRGPLETYL